MYRCIGTPKWYSRTRSKKLRDAIWEEKEEEEEEEEEEEVVVVDEDNWG
jgi:hypothetical protein